MAVNSETSSLSVSILWFIIVTKFIRIGIADKNDYPLYFEKAVYEAEVDENEDIRHTVLTVTAQDYDEESQIRYQITSGNLGDVFEVDEITGEIYVAASLDYETRKHYELNLTVTDNVRENYTNVVIKVRDVNDNPPVFERATYRTQITEGDDRNLPKRVLQVTAVDGDRDRPQDILYFLTGPGVDPDDPVNSKFKINRTTGEIFVLKPLDRDQPNGKPQWRFTVFAQDEGGEGLVGYADIQVNLKDINDNAPIFLQEIYHGNVTESGPSGLVVMTISAVDYDDPLEGNNAKLIYSIEKNVIEESVGQAIFEIERDTGVIRTAICCLDRERTPDYLIQVVAMDGGGLKGTGTASIRVLDINDMSPSFTKDEWFIEVDETEGDRLPDLPILIVTVNDGDEINDFHFQVVEDSGFGANKFLLLGNSDGTGSLMIGQPLDYEDAKQRNGFRFRIKVNDKGNSSEDELHVAYSWVVVKIRDVNDNVPQFEKDTFRISVPENAAIGRFITTLAAQDVDDGGKSKISFAIDKNSDRKRQFSVTQEGTVLIHRHLDREENASHELKILAIDDGVHPKTATATISVIVEDVNDNAPSFKYNYRPVIQEHSSPRQILELFAKDDDDPLKKNGPPFTFSMSSNASDEIKSGFKLETIQSGDDGRGTVMLSSMVAFDREVHKEYHIPIIMTDSGELPMSATRTLTVIIGDINDNLMQPGFKHIIVYNYMGQTPDTEIGLVYVHDLDDWDITDKTFYWQTQEHPRFALNINSGMITMRQGTLDGIYQLYFKVYDRKHAQKYVSANVTVVVKEISREAILESGSIRIEGITDEEFIRNWDYKLQSRTTSIAERLKNKLVSLFQTRAKNVDIFCVQSRNKPQQHTDVRFSVYNSGYFKPVRLNGILIMNRSEIEEEIGLNISSVGTDKCFSESKDCEGSCTNVLHVKNSPYLVNANTTALVCVQVDVIGECKCSARSLTKPTSCYSSPCLNGGSCVESSSGTSCICLPGYMGPRCQQTAHSFFGNGWAWFPTLELCENSHLSLEFITHKPHGQLIYNGPIASPISGYEINSDFISLELYEGRPRLLINFGSGTLELNVQTKQPINDGEWHRIDIFWQSQTVLMLVDLCKSADIAEPENDTPLYLDDSSCKVSGKSPPFNEYLNLKTPLQIGGRYGKEFDPAEYNWKAVPRGKGFDGCIRNILHNSKLYDLANPALSNNSVPGCRHMETICNKQGTSSYCGDNGVCTGSLSDTSCECLIGYTGPSCSIPTTPITFRSQSYVKYALSFDPDRFASNIQLRFRTREASGEMFRLSDQHSREYAILELQNGTLHFRYNLNNLQTHETDLCLNELRINDGVWHTVKGNDSCNVICNYDSFGTNTGLTRPEPPLPRPPGKPSPARTNRLYCSNTQNVLRAGTSAILEVDGGEGIWYNETFTFHGHQWLLVDKQEGVHAGGRAEFTGVKTFEVFSDYQKGCLDDIRLDGKQLPLPPAMNGTQWGQATMAKNVERNCPSNNPCASTVCPDPYECIDLWNEFKCSCGEGKTVSHDGKGCSDKNECLDRPCQNGGLCINQDPKTRYRCVCPNSYFGANCELYQEGQTLKLGVGAVVAILSCLIIILVLVLLFNIYSQKRKVHKKACKPAEDIRENMFTYDDEGGGEDDMTAVDMIPLQVQADVTITGLSEKVPATSLNPIDGQYPEINTDDINSPPFDELRNFSFEGSGSSAGSLSSVISGINLNECGEFGHLEKWGSRFDKLALMFSKPLNHPDVQKQ